MTREEFAEHVEWTLEKVIEFAEEKGRTRLGRKIAFNWVFHEGERIYQNIPEYIADRLFVNDELIYPCCDIGVGDILEDGTVVIVGSVSGYKPVPFQTNWTGRDGPFVYVVWEKAVNKMTSNPSM